MFALGILLACSSCGEKPSPDRLVTTIEATQSDVLRDLSLDRLEDLLLQGLKLSPDQQQRLATALLPRLAEGGDIKRRVASVLERCDDSRVTERLAEILRTKDPTVSDELLRLIRSHPSVEGIAYLEITLAKTDRPKGNRLAEADALYVCSFQHPEEGAIALDRLCALTTLEPDVRARLVQSRDVLRARKAEKDRLKAAGLIP